MKSLEQTVRVSMPLDPIVVFTRSLGRLKNRLVNTNRSSSRFWLRLRTASNAHDVKISDENRIYLHFYQRSKLSKSRIIYFFFNIYVISQER